MEWRPIQSDFQSIKDKTNLDQKVWYQIPLKMMVISYFPENRPLAQVNPFLCLDGPTKVMVNLYVRSFEKIDDVKMEFSVQITFRWV